MKAEGYRIRDECSGAVPLSFILYPFFVSLLRTALHLAVSSFPFLPFFPSVPCHFLWVRRSLIVTVVNSAGQEPSA
jgi:hypothetical protein